MLHGRFSVAAGATNAATGAPVAAAAHALAASSVGAAAVAAAGAVHEHGPVQGERRVRLPAELQRKDVWW